MPRFERDDRFWEIERDGRRLRVRSGRIGEPGEQLVHSAHFEAEAMREFDDRIEAKLAEGYRPVEQPREQIGALDPAMAAAVLAALDPEQLATPDGPELLRAAWSVLGDWLSAQGDVRGELIAIDETLAYVDGPGRARLLGRRDKLLTQWIPRWLGDYGKLDGPDRPISLAWDHGFIAAARIGTEPGGLDLSRWRLGLRDLVPVLDTMLSHPLALPIQQLRIGELDPRSRRDLARALPILQLDRRPALIRLELGGVSRGRWARDETGNLRQRVALARIGSLAPLALASDWAPRLAALRIVGTELRVFPPLSQLRVLELQVPTLDEELRRWLVDGPWPVLERLWLRCTHINDPWSNAGGPGLDNEGPNLDELLVALTQTRLRELGLQGPSALDRVLEFAINRPLKLTELRLFGLTDNAVDALLEAHEFFGDIDRIVLEQCESVRRWPELQRRYGAQLHTCDQTFGVVGEREGDDLRESLFDAPGWAAP
ncbi:WGR domain protein [Enhygromyxa salina]|uniref:WGR domain protein n=1 Tax=Enhygromyxa salina TaxID=215803 RepID=A0A0C1ZR27_9BACT|nr:WGR domain-containing protein [Enhygromyxa salina]KIG13453.1 WGR domain protein [Enhygromyxa salina]